MPVARVAAQAKVNLFLQVGEPRPDGFHDVFTMFQLLDLADDVVVRVGGAGRTLHVAGARIPEDGLGPTDKNLAFRAALAYAARTGWPAGFSIELLKNIPAGGGLGGGSSDAGAVLRGLNALNERPLGQADLFAVAASLGSDVAFFVSGSARALATGRGEEVHDLEPLDARDVLLVIPPFGVPTADAYRWLDEDRAEAKAAAPASARAKRSVESVLFDSLSPPEALNDWAFIGRASHNDFEPAVERRHPDLRAVRERLNHAGAALAHLSGSGSTVFAVFEALPTLPTDLPAGAVVLRTRTSRRVVQVEVQE